MRRTVAVLTLAIAVIAVVPTVAGARPPVRAPLDINESGQDAGLTALCGTPVIVTAIGTGQATLWHDEAGLVVRELDRFSRVRRTFTAPETGQSFSIRYDAVSRWDYGAGARIGSPVTISAHGLFFHIPGFTSAVAGAETAVGVVDHFENGIPIVEGATEIRRVGHIPDIDFGAAICEALT